MTRFEVWEDDPPKPKEKVISWRFFRSGSGLTLYAVDAQGHSITGGCVLHIEAGKPIEFFPISAELDLPLDSKGYAQYVAVDPQQCLDLLGIHKETDDPDTTP